MARTKVTPPVTPRIVQQHSSRGALWGLLLLSGVLLIAWYSYDYGRSRGGGYIDAEAVTDAREFEQRIDALNLERASLQAQITHLEQELGSSRRSLAQAEETIQKLKQASKVLPKPAEIKPPKRVSKNQSTSQAARSPAAPPPRTDAALAQEATRSVPTPVGDKTALRELKVDDFQLTPADAENAYRFGFSLTREGGGTRWVTGTIWIAVNGFIDGRPKRLAYRKISADKRGFVKMRFQEQQDVTGEVTLPANFTPENILIEAKPDQSKYKSTSVSFDWLADEPVNLQAAENNNAPDVPAQLVEPSATPNSPPPVGAVTSDPVE